MCAQRAVVVVLLFPKDIAIASILILAFGDSISHVVGKFGSMKHPFTDKKFLEGFVAGSIAAFIASFIVVGRIEALLGSVIAMSVESLDIKIKKVKVDDNLLMPIAK